MKKQRSRELLLNIKSAQKWEQSFDTTVDELMDLVCKVDNHHQVNRATGLMDVYSKKKKTVKNYYWQCRDTNERPFEFLVYHN